VRLVDERLTTVSAHQALHEAGRHVKDFRGVVDQAAAVVILEHALDEAHERSLNIDFILGYLKRILPQRPDLKVIITSATIDPERFARHFAPSFVPGKGVVDDSLSDEERELAEQILPDDAPPIIEVSGRTYPVEIRYRPLDGDGYADEDEGDEDPELGGGTDIDQALAYCQSLITRPADTTLVLVTDLEEGGNSQAMRRRMVELVQSGVQFIVLLALNDDGAPFYDKSHAAFPASGTSECEVMPGAILISSSHGRFASPRIKSTRAQPFAPMLANARLVSA